MVEGSAIVVVEIEVCHAPRESVEVQTKSGATSDCGVFPLQGL